LLAMLNKAPEDPHRDMEAGTDAAEAAPRDCADPAGTEAIGGKHISTLEPPFRFEPSLAADDLQAIGRLAVKWSAIESIIGNCLTVLRLVDEATLNVFLLSASAGLNKIQELATADPLNEKGQEALDALVPVVKALQFVRNTIIHGVIKDDAGSLSFLSKSKGHSLTVDEVLSTEELVNYVAHAVYALRYALGIKGFENQSWPLPERPAIPEFLLEEFPELQVNNG